MKQNLKRNFKLHEEALKQQDINQFIRIMRY